MLLVVLALLSLASGSGSSSSRLSGRSDPHHETTGGHPEDPVGEAQLEDVEARFFLKEKLCQLGLMECEVDALNYVQPVRVVPVGDPVPAVTLDKNYIPNIGYSSERSSYGAPQSSYGAPLSGYGAPRPTYGAPKPTYEATKSSYGAPKPSYGAPKPSYGAPSYRAPKPTYGVSKQRPTYKKPSSSYSSYGAPSSGSSLSGPQVNAGATSSFGYGELSGSYSSQARPVREGRVDECYCLPVAQCPAGQVIGQVNQNKDYGALIDPRVKGSQSNISADPTPVTGGERRRRESSESTSLLDYQTEFAQRSGRSGEPFGPTGFRPPTCGGVSSGYVCCRLQVGFDFNELTSQPGAIRDIRQPNQVDTQFSSFGQCGRRNAHSTAQRINNPLLNFQEGDAEFGEYPWQAALLKKEQYDNVYVCGGSLIDNTHLITAAHCITQYRPEQLRVRLGEWDVNNDSEFYPNLELDVLTIKIHPEYTPGNLYNDIAILKLDGFIDFLRNPHISPVCLPDNFQAFTNYRCYVSGWGKDTFGDGGNYQHLLKEVDLPVLDSRDCENKLRRTRLGNDFVLHPGFMCAGGEEGKDSCKGDGGGPLVCEVGQVWYLAGIVSWGIGCGQRDVPGVYTKVNYYNAWIQESMLA